MIRIGIISDTHISAIDEDAERLINLLNRLFVGCDLIVHAGDIISVEFVKELQRVFHVEAVHGNMDLPQTRQTYPQKKIIEADGKFIGIIHGSGPPEGIRKRVTVNFDIKPDIIIYGHTHEPFAGFDEGIYFINPGSPNDTRFAFVNSVAVLTISNRKHNAEIIRFKWSEIKRSINIG
jgi:hypothetical protein